MAIQHEAKILKIASSLGITDRVTVRATAVATPVGVNDGEGRCHHTRLVSMSTVPSGKDVEEEMTGTNIYIKKMEI